MIDRTPSLRKVSNSFPFSGKEKLYFTGSTNIIQGVEYLIFLQLFQLIFNTEMQLDSI